MPVGKGGMRRSQCERQDYRIPLVTDSQERGKKMLTKKRKLFRCSITICVLLGLILAACAPAPTPEPEPAAPTSTAVATQPTPTQAEAEPPAKGGSVIVGFKQEPDSFDPAGTYNSWNRGELGMMYDTLVYWAPDKEFYPGLAESWEISDDGKTYTFYLREDVTFHDGSAFDAEAVKFSFDRIGVALTTIGKGAEGILGSYESIEVVDDYTVKVHFAEPSAVFLITVADPFLGIVSPAAVEEWGDEDFGFHPVGTGPFVFEEWVAGGHLTVVKNPDYNWAPEFFGHQGPAYLDQITYRYIDEDATRLMALEMGEVQVVNQVPELDVDRVREVEGLSVLTVETPMLPECILLNTQKYPLDDVRVRQAILYAVDRDTLVQTLFHNNYPAAYGPLSPGNPFYWSGVEELYPFDPETAKGLLTDAGWEPGSDGIRVDEDGNILTLDLLYPGQEHRARSYEFAQAQLREVGIDITIQEMESAAMFEEAVAGNNALSQLQWGFSDPSAMRIFWHSSNEGTGFNWSHVRSETLDELLERGESSVDPSEREAIYQELQQIIMEEAYMLPLFVTTSFHGASTDVHGLVVRPTARTYWFQDAYMEE